MPIPLQITPTTELTEQTKNQLFELWNAEYPEKICYASLAELELYLQKLSHLKHLFLLDKEENILGWAYAFDRENERWFAIIIDEKCQRQGWGRKMLDELKKSENVLNGWVTDHDNHQKRNGQTYFSPLKFYVKCGFEMLTNEILQLDKISAVKIKWTAKSD